ncbi:MAG: hypothetical protein LBV30_05750 [Propionibacteriaceae bacterium]|jgi:hypothetical protein|nr:hypothetical protein [Propionibacteriaceae bacterium]
MSGEIKLEARDAQAVATVLHLASDTQATRVWRLTDEQIAILDAPDAPLLVEQTWLEDRLGDPGDPALLAMAEEVALRSLVASGDVAVQVSDGDITEVTARPEITGSLLLRRLGKAMMRVVRVTDDDSSLAYFYLQDSGEIFEEAVDQNGMHDFSVYHEPIWRSRLAEFIDPVAGAGLGQIDQVVTADVLEGAVADYPQLTQAVSVSQLTAVLRDNDQPRVATIFSGPAGCYWLRSDADLADDQLRLTGIDPDQLAGLGEELTRG